MQTCAAMLSQVSRKSVVLIDELGRGTSHHEGFGIVYAIAEELIVRKSTTFFATHYSELPAILDAQPSVVLKYLQVDLTKDGKKSTFTFKHKIALGQAKK
jgi:DNA mismatch repair protein MSH4